LCGLALWYKIRPTNKFFFLKVLHTEMVVYLPIQWYLSLIMMRVKKQKLWIPLSDRGLNALSHTCTVRTHWLCFLPDNIVLFLLTLPLAGLTNTSFSLCQIRKWILHKYIYIYIYEYINKYIYFCHLRMRYVPLSSCLRVIRPCKNHT